jgi:hypothetical protein
MPDPSPATRNPRGEAYPLVGAFGLFVLAVHGALGNGLVSLNSQFGVQALMAAIPQIWPYLVFAAALLGSRRWARDLGAPAALLAMVRALASFPRYVFLGWATAQMQGASASQGAWRVLRHSLATLGAYAALCAVTFYVLTRPELIQKCQSERKQPGWTDGLAFAALLLVSCQLFTASASLSEALYRVQSLPSLQDLQAGGWHSLGDLQRGALTAVAMSALGLAALVGLWRRRGWGWTALLAQSLILLYLTVQGSFGKAQAAVDIALKKFPAVVLPLGLEAFCRNLPELAALGVVLWALARARRQFSA